MRTWRSAARAKRAAGLSLLALLASGLSSGCGTTDDDSGSPSLELHPCAGAGIADAMCGVLSVEENRTDPNGRQVELAIFVAPATSRTPSADPVFLLAGGPGQGAAEIGPRIVHKFDAIRRDRALVFVDLRGTGSAGPLRCDVEDLDDLDELLGAKFEFDKLDACLAEYKDERGATDLSQYSTFTMVEDLEAVRVALGYPQVNLLGISYGTRVALEYARQNPDHTRSVVLDGVVPADLGVLLAAPANSEAALDLLLADCREAPDCAAMYPGLERKLEQVLTDLETNRVLEQVDHPRTGAPIRVDITRAGFVGVLRAALYSGYFTALIPNLIDRAHAGDYGPTAALALSTAKMSKSLSVGLYFTVVCGEDLRGLTPAARREAAAGLGVFDDHLLAQLEQVCARWPHAEHGPERFTPVESDAPILLLSGRYDPVTPPATAERAAATLSNSRHVIAENVSHGVWHQGCAPELIAEFFANPDPAGLDASCIESIPRARMFLGPNGPRRSATVEPEHALEQPQRAGFQLVHHPIAQEHGR